MKKFIPILFLLPVLPVGNYTIHAQTPDFVWAQRAGGTDNDRGNDIAVDGSGNSVVVGFFRGSADFGGTTFTGVSARDVFVAKYDPNGNLIWLRHAGGVATGGQSGPTSGEGVTTDASDNIIATGAYIGSITFGTTTLPIGGPQEELFLVKYDPNGNLLWAKAATGSQSVAGFQVATDDAENIYVTGTFGHHNFGGKVTFDTITLTSVGGGDVFVAKYDPNGNVLWAKRAGSTNTNNTDVGHDIATDGSGNSVIAGRFKGTADFGTTTLSSAGSFDIFIAKYDANGSLVWAKRDGGTGNDKGLGIAMDSGGNIIITGRFSGTASFGSTTLTSLGGVDILISKYDAGGNVLWAKRAGGSESGVDTDIGSKVDIDGSGNGLVTGFFSGTADFGMTTLTSNGTEDVFVAKCDPSGNFLWAKRAGGSDSGADTDQGAGIAIDGSDNTLVTGYFSGTADFDAETRTSAGGREIFIAKLGPSNQPPDCSGAVIADHSADANCQATISGADVTAVIDPDGDPLTITVSPTTLVLGANTVTVTADDGNGGTCSTDITVNVVDDTAPVPDVANLPDATGECSVTLTAPTATDNCAGSITATTTDPTTYTTQGSFSVTWTYDDGNGNTSQQTQNVIVDDVTDPVITLNGANPLTLIRFSGPYVEPEAVVTDNCNPSPSLAISGTVDTNLPGSYPVTYNADDGNGNTSQVIRTVNVIDDPNALDHPYLYLADKKIMLDKMGRSDGDIHSNDKIDLKKGPATFSGDVTAVGKIDIAKDVTIEGDVTAGDELQLDNNVTITGTATEFASVSSVALPSLSYSAGGNDVKVEKNQTQSLTPGSYGKVEVEENGTLQLSTGDYFFEELILKKEVNLEIDLATGPVTVNVERKIDMNMDVQMSLAPLGESDSRYVTINSMEDMQIDKNSVLLGTFNAPLGKVHFKKDVNLRGSICSEEIDVEKDAVALHHDAAGTLPLAKVSSPAEEREETQDSSTGSIPKDFGLSQNHPNPFNPSTTITFAVPEASEVKLAIYNLRGQLIQTLHSGVISAGQHSVVWDGTDFLGAKVASGVYVYRLESKGFVLSKKLVFMK